MHGHLNVKYTETLTFTSLPQGWHWGPAFTKFIPETLLPIHEQNIFTFPRWSHVYYTQQIKLDYVT